MGKLSEQEYLIALNMVEDLGSIRSMRLINAFSRPSRIFEANFNELFGIEGIGPVIARRINEIINSALFDEELKLIKKGDIRVITIFDKNYPELLKQIYDPPIILYLRGDDSVLDELSVAIVGCRRASFYGLQQAGRIASVLALRGVCVVSGLARGIDTAAHKGALSVGGKTVAVLGSGLNDIYPAENEELAERIVGKKGAVISEFPLRMTPQKGNFPRRNRIISGLCRAVIVVEAAKRSGSLITADLALEQGREVYAVPGPANSLNAQGTNKLIKEGAKLIENADDVLQELNLSNLIQEEDKHNEGSREIINNAKISEEARGVLQFLSLEPLHIDLLVKESKLNAVNVYKSLLELQLKGLVKEIGGKRFIRKEAV